MRELKELRISSRDCPAFIRTLLDFSICHQSMFGENKVRGKPQASHMIHVMFIVLLFFI